MRLRRWASAYLIWGFLVAVFLSSHSHSLLARKIVGPPTREEVATTWIGVSEDELYLFRLVLYSEGEGSIGYVFAQDKPTIYPISSWHYENGAIEIDTDFPPGIEDWKGPLKGEVTPRDMTLQMSGQGWSRSIFLRREAEFESRWLALKASMPAPENDNQD